MRVGTPKEIKVHEYRVGLTPAGVGELVAHGHEVWIETGAGVAVGLSDEAYRKQGARIADDADALFEACELIVKVKEPQPAECARLGEHHTLFTFLHLAPDPLQTTALLASGCTAVAYETVRDAGGGLPLLAPMSEVAGRMSIQAGAHALEKSSGGRGVLLGGVPGVNPARVLILGGGVVGYNAARMAVGAGARVTVVDRSLARLQWLDAHFEGRFETLYSTREAILTALAQSDLVIGAVLVPGAAAPRLIRREDLRVMQAGAVLVDVAIDQGGCFETSRPTTHDQPTYLECGIVHYCVANMPGAVARTSTFALTNATLPYVLRLADTGVARALLEDPALREGLNVHRGALTHKAVAEALGVPYTPAAEALRPWWAHPDDA